MKCVVPNLLTLNDSPPSQHSMGILTRRHGEAFVISSDQPPGALPSKRAAPRLSDVYQVWTGATWSPDATEALNFDTLAAADDYVKANYAKVSAVSVKQAI